MDQEREDYADHPIPPRWVGPVTALGFFVGVVVGCVLIVGCVTIPVWLD